MLKSNKKLSIPFINPDLVALMHEKRMIQASDIADSTERSLQNISYAMRELEEKGLIMCITPDKHTWKKYILTEKGTEVFEDLKKNNRGIIFFDIYRVELLFFRSIMNTPNVVARFVRIIIQNTTSAKY